MGSTTLNRIDISRLTIRLSLCQSLGEIDKRLPDEVWITRVISVTLKPHKVPALNLLGTLLLWRQRWGSVAPWCRPNKTSLYILEYGEPELLVPLWVLATALDDFSSSLLLIQRHQAIRSLFPNMPFIWQVSLS